MKKIFGDFVEKQDCQEYLILSFSSDTLPIKDRWRNNSLSADFLANYWGTILPRHEGDSHLHHHQEVKDAVGYLCNELLENAIKFSDEKSGIPIRIRLYLSENHLRFYVTNAVVPAAVDDFQKHIQVLLTDDPNELYFRRLEENAESDLGSSGLGYLTMLIDYYVKLAWKFESAENEPGNTTVTTMVEIEIQRN